jgi:cell division septation protein DedD
MDYNNDYNNRHTSTRDASAGGLFSSPMPFALALLGGGAAIFGLWYFFYAGTHSQSNHPIPVIKAEAGPMKVRPDNASQPEVPHQDKLVYGRVNPAEKGTGVERLLPPTEEPMDLPVREVETIPAADEGFPSPKAAQESQFRAGTPDDKLETPAPATQSKTPDAAREVTLSVDQMTGAKAPENLGAANGSEESTPSSTATPPLEAKPNAPMPKTLQSGYRVQLASMKSQEQAENEWSHIQKAHKGLLGGFSAHFPRVDLGAKKGIFYRVQVGDFSSKEEATKVCHNLKNNSSGIDCFIVKF